MVSVAALSELRMSLGRGSEQLDLSAHAEGKIGCEHAK